MPVTISDQEYKEYLTIRHNLDRQARLDSVRSMGTLEHDIDAPIKNVVAMLALLGCVPFFSCCGFDYEGQPLHKSHEYGGCFVSLRKNDNSDQVVDQMSHHEFASDSQINRSEHSGWYYWEHDKVIYLRSYFSYFHSKSKYPWASKNSLHFAELAVFRLAEMEKFLRNFEYAFLDEIIIKDTNHGYANLYEHWQYPALEPWVIRKEDIV